MLIDLSVKVTTFVRQEASDNEKMASLGHLGTHFDVMNKEFPLEFVKREGIVFDVCRITGREVEEQDIDITKVKKDMFVAFSSGFIDRVEYGSQKYFADHPQLSNRLIDILLEKGVSIIGVDFAGVRRGKEHTPKDRYCADKGVFIVENLCHLDRVLHGKRDAGFVANTYPIHFDGMTGLPCRVVAEL